jgi:hypothetical protein
MYIRTSTIIPRLRYHIGRQEASGLAGSLSVIVLMIMICSHAPLAAQTAPDTMRVVVGDPEGGDTMWLPVPGHLWRLFSTDTTDITRRQTPLHRLRTTVTLDHPMIRDYLDSLQNTPEAIMRRNLAMDPSLWRPTDADRARRDDDIKRSQGWDQIYQNIPRVGFSIPLSSIGRALGLVEDVTPRIKYTLLATDNVTVKVYDLMARTVAVMVDGVQSPGEYRMDWNMRDDNGHRVSSGDYVAEVVVGGKRLMLRKRIEVP